MGIFAERGRETRRGIFGTGVSQCRPWCISPVLRGHRVSFCLFEDFTGGNNDTRIFLDGEKDNRNPPPGEFWNSDAKEQKLMTPLKREKGHGRRVFCSRRLRIENPKKQNPEKIVSEPSGIYGYFFRP